MQQLLARGARYGMAMRALTWGDSGLRDGSANLALDREQRLRTGAGGVPLLRFWACTPTANLGAHEDEAHARIIYVAPDKVSPFEILTNYQTALKSAGFTTLFQCQTDGCRNGDWDVNLFQDQEDAWYNCGGYQYQFSAQRAGTNGTVYVGLHLTNRPVQITLDVIEPHAMASGMIQ